MQVCFAVIMPYRYPFSVTRYCYPSPLLHTGTHYRYALPLRGAFVFTDTPYRMPYRCAVLLDHTVMPYRYAELLRLTVELKITITDKSGATAPNHNNNLHEKTTNIAKNEF